MSSYFFSQVLPFPHADNKSRPRSDVNGRPRLHMSVRVSASGHRTALGYLASGELAICFYVYTYSGSQFSPSSMRGPGNVTGKEVSTCLPPPQAHIDPVSHLQSPNKPTCHSQRLNVLNRAHPHPSLRCSLSTRKRDANVNRNAM